MCAASLHVAVIHSPDAVRLVVAAESRAVLTERIAQYVREQANDQLKPNDAREVHRRLHEGDAAGAVELYFASVGQRWEDEWLYVGQVDVAEGAEAAEAFARG